MLQRSIELAYKDRWWAILGVAVQNALAASLLVADGRRLVLDAAADAEPELDSVLDGQRWALDAAAGFD